MADRRGDVTRQPPFSSAQDRVFDGGGGGAPGPAPYGGEIDQGSYMALLAAGVGSQPPWAVVDDVTAPPAIHMTPHFSMTNYASPSYQHPDSLAAGLHPNSSYLQAVDAPPQWPPPPTPSSYLLPPNFAVITEQHHMQHQQLLRAAAFGGSSDMHAAVPATIEQPAKDGYNWRKYGQKQLKDAESPRSYYKCTSDGCPVKKIVERSSDGCIKEITYRGRHNHPRPMEPRRGGAGAVSSSGGDNAVGNAAAAAEVDEDEPTDDDDGEEGQDRGADGEAGQRVVRKPKIILQTVSAVDLLDDGYRWRKYGQKVVKGNPRPRSYYKCTADGCNVRKQIERASADPKCVLTTYTGRHSHDPPGRAAAAAAAAAAGGSSGNLQLPEGPAMNLAGGLAQQQPISGGARRMKEET
ncbi:hypothetical protein GUJ93_ZPchr0013g34765 [Zizania palustris]|uniref:WRKY domain-containing protein n=1 Tax=Zizania palustris TaxID=103762 RepID=A0A8J5WYK5_ZIZPA|nr:hypothetical protein GUJ93_ZPchr0013g34765 [Zizania palustris]